MIEKYEKVFEITSYECDENCVLRLRSLFNLFQEMANINADALGVGYSYCMAHQLGWIGGAYHVQIERLPHWGDTVILRTWPSKATPLTAIREFEMIDKITGEVIVRASSQWVLIDTNRMRPVLVTPHISHFKPLAERSIETAFPKLAPVEKKDIVCFAQIRQDDIDLNHHVNNAVYPALILDAFPPNYQTTALKELQIQYRQPIKEKTTVLIQTQIEECACRHTIMNEAETVEYARIYTRFNK